VAAAPGEKEESLGELPDPRMSARLRWLARTGIDPLALRGKIIVVAGFKGGIGKTLLALEMAYLFGAVLLDLEWDAGSASVALGYREEQRTRAPLLDAIARGRMPRPLVGGPTRPDLVPGHSDFEINQPTAKRMADLIEEWATAWGTERGCPVVIDTHPGGSPSTLGAIAAAHVVVAPAVLAEREMEALDDMLDKLPGAPLLLVPNKVGISPPDYYVRWLERIAEKASVPIGPEIGRYPWLEQRKLRMALTAADRPVPAKHRVLVEELHEVGGAVARYALAAA
jgi:chromosome partitioning protein